MNNPKISRITPALFLILICILTACSRDTSANTRIHVPWQSYEIRDGHTVEFEVFLELPSCYEIDAEVSESEEELAISFFRVPVDEAPGVCPAKAAVEKIAVDTQAPVAELRIYDPLQ